MTWWRRNNSWILVSWLAFAIVALFLWRAEKSVSPQVLGLSYVPLRPSYLLILMDTAVHALIWRWQDREAGWLWALWCAQVYAATIIAMIIWKLTQALNG